MLYLRARYYSPNLGVFTSLDPFEGIEDEPMSLNGYSYVEGNPVNWIDATGEQTGVLEGAALLCLANPAACALAIGIGYVIGRALAESYQENPNKLNSIVESIGCTINKGLTALGQLIQIGGHYLFATPSAGNPSIQVSPIPTAPGFGTQPRIGPVPPFGTQQPLDNILPHETQQPFGSVLPHETQQAPATVEIYPAPTPPAPGWNVFYSGPIPGPDDWTSFTNRTLGNPPGGISYGIYDYWEKQREGQPRLYYIGSARKQSLLVRLQQHTRPNDPHPLESLAVAKWTVLTPKSGIDPSVGILVAETIRKAQLIAMGVPLSNEGTPANTATVRYFWEQKGYEKFTNWPEWLYPPESLLK